MNSFSYKTARNILAALLALAAGVVWFASIPGAEPRHRAVLGGLLLAAALVGSPLSDYLSVAPRGRH